MRFARPAASVVTISVVKPLPATIEDAYRQKDRHAFRQHLITVDAQQVRVGLSRPFARVTRVKRTQGLRWADAQCIRRCLRNRQRREYRASGSRKKVTTLQCLGVV